MSIGTISGGIKTNVVPDGCRIAVDIRTVPGQDHKAILAQVEGLLKELARKDDDLRGEARILSDLPTLLTPPRDPLVKVALKAAQAVTGQAHKPRRVMYLYRWGGLRAPTKDPHGHLRAGKGRPSPPAR